MSRGFSTKQKEEVVINYNKLAMEQLQQDSYENSMSYLKQALMGIKVITEEHTKNKLMAITFNNLGCLFKRTTNYSEALKYLLKAISLENKLPNESATIAGAHLNICSILSQQGDHPKAIRHGLRSIFLLKNVYREQPKHLPTLVIAYHNVGTEYQLMGHLEDAEDCLKIGHKLGFDFLGPQHNLTVTLKNTLNSLVRRGKSPNYDYFTKARSPKTRLPIVSAKSRSTSQESRKSLYRPTAYDHYPTKPTERDFYSRKANLSRNKNRVAPKVEIQKPFVPKIFSDEEVSMLTDKSFSSLASSSRKIDLGQHKATEKAAAVMIQSAWRGFKARKRFEEEKLNYKLKQAEQKARRAVEEYEKLKQIAAKPKPKFTAK